MQTVIERHMTAGPEVQRKLNASKEGAEGMPLRTIRCPGCGFYLLEVYGHDHCYIRVKCRKYKFSDTIDTALFRTMRKHQVNRLKAYANALGKVRQDE